MNILIFRPQAFIKMKLERVSTDLSKVGHHNFHKMCKLGAREGIANLVIVQQTV